MINMINKSISSINVFIVCLSISLFRIYLSNSILKARFYLLLLLIIFQLLILWFLFLWITFKWWLLHFKRFIIIINTLMFYRIRRYLLIIGSIVSFIAFSAMSLKGCSILKIRLLNKILRFSYQTTIRILLLLVLNCFNFIIFRNYTIYCLLYLIVFNKVFKITSIIPFLLAFLSLTLNERPTTIT